MRTTHEGVAGPLPNGTAQSPAGLGLPRWPRSGRGRTREQAAGGEGPLAPDVSILL